MKIATAHLSFVRPALLSGCLLVVPVAPWLYSQQAAVQQAIKLTQIGRMPEAEAAWKKLALAQPKNASVHAALGQVLAREGLLEQATTEYRKSLALNSHQPDVSLNLGLAEFKQGKFAAAIDPLLAARRQHPGEPRTGLLLGMSYYAKAVPYLQTAVTADPANQKLHKVLAESCLWSGNYDCATSEYQGMLATEPNSAQSHMLMAQALDGMNRSPEAIKELEEAARLSPDEPDVHFELGYLYFVAHDYDHAAPQLELELKHNPDHAQACAYLGDIKLRTNDQPEAERLLTQALHLQPDMRMAWFDLGKVLSDEDKNQQALAAFQKAESVDPPTPTLTTALPVSTPHSARSRKRTRSTPGRKNSTARQPIRSSRRSPTAITDRTSETISPRRHALLNLMTGRPIFASRREFLWMAASTAALGQGVVPRNVAPQPRGKPSGLPFHAHFTDVAATAGLTHPIVYGGLDRKDYIVETIGCGIAFFDFDNDGWLDIFMPCGSRMESAPPDATNRLYKNNRDGTFTDVTQKAGLFRKGWASGITIADYNNDGNEDIFITYYGQNVLYRNNGDETFTDVTMEAGLLYPGPPRWGSGCTFIDYDRDGHLDLFIATYVDLNKGKLPKPGENPFCNFKGVPVNCGPRGLAMGSNFLYRNQGDGTFIDVTNKAGIPKAVKTYAMTVVAADLDNDGWTDLYLASDSTPSLLFRNHHDGTFTEEGSERGIALSDEGTEQAGMGIAIGDYDLDGNLDVFKTHFSDDCSVLYKNDGSGNFTDTTIKSGLAVETRYISWGTGFADFDNDGIPDLAVVTGSVYPEIERKFPQYPLKTPRMIFHNLGNGRFEELIDEAGPGISASHCSRGGAFGDFDNDGDVDLLIANLNESPSLLRNDVTGGGN